MVGGDGPSPLWVAPSLSRYAWAVLRILAQHKFGSEPESEPGSRVSPWSLSSGTYLEVLP